MLLFLKIYSLSVCVPSELFFASPLKRTCMCMWGGGGCCATLISQSLTLFVAPSFFLPLHSASVSLSSLPPYVSYLLTLPSSSLSFPTFISTLPPSGSFHLFPFCLHFILSFSLNIIHVTVTLLISLSHKGNTNICKQA